MSAGRVFVSRRIPQAGLDLLTAAGHQVNVGQDDEEKGIGQAALLAGLKDCDVLISLLSEPLNESTLASHADLQGIAQMAVGFNNIDIDAATRLGIPVSNTPDVLTETSADFTWAMLMAVARRVPEAHAYMTGGRFEIWGPNLLLGTDVGPGASGRPKVLGIVGYGRIGQAVARRAQGFSMEVLACNRREIERDGLAAQVGLDELLQRSDFVSLHTPLTAETRHLIGEAQLRRMKKSAFLINTARGEVVDEDALVRALRNGWIAGAALDVYEHEPLTAEGLLELPNVALFPHIASASQDTRDRMATMAAENALAHLKLQRAPNVVNPEVYDTDAYRQRARG